MWPFRGIAEVILGKKYEIKFRIGSPYWNLDPIERTLSGRPYGGGDPKADAVLKDMRVSARLRLERMDTETRNKYGCIREVRWI